MSPSRGDSLTAPKPQGLLGWLVRSFRSVCRANGRPSSRKTQARVGGFAAESLELRIAMSATPAVVMESATTKDSKSVTIDYNVVSAPDAQHPLTFGIYRSADATLSADDTPVSSETIVLPGQGAPRELF